jgi:FkbM family methyltransferase
MKILEKVKLYLRAKKYKNSDDRGGIKYINDNIQQGQIILDIGAHKAGYLFFIRKKVGFNGKIYAFEPQTILFDYLIKIKKIMNWENVTIEKIAMSDKMESVTLYIPCNKTGQNTSPSATIIENNNIKSIARTETVNTDTLDNYCSKYGINPNLIKIDVEGNELKVFKGGLNILKEFKPKIIVEIEAIHVGKDQVIETFEFLKSIGYEGKIVHNKSLVPIEKFSFEKYQNEGDKANYCNNFIFE